MPVVMLVVGTRPEAIKMAPVAQAILDALPRPTPATLSRLLPRTA